MPGIEWDRNERGGAHSQYASATWLLLAVLFCVLIAGAVWTDGALWLLWGLGGLACALIILIQWARQFLAVLKYRPALSWNPMSLLPLASPLLVWSIVSWQASRTHFVGSCEHVLGSERLRLWKDGTCSYRDRNGRHRGFWVEERDTVWVSISELGSRPCGFVIREHGSLVPAGVEGWHLAHSFTP